MVYRPYKKPYTKRRKFVGGQDRVGGFYGRYAQSGLNQAGELKFHDVDLDDAVVAVGGAVTSTVNIIAEGNGESTRVGRKCTIRSIHWRYQVQLPEVDAQGTPSPGETLRVMMYVDKQCNGATIANTDLLATADWQSFRNLSNSSRFVVLYDKNHTLNYSGLASDGAGVVSQGNRQIEVVWNKKCGITLEYDNPAGGLANIRSNNIGVMLVSSRGAIGFESKIRLRFSDN